MSNHLHQPDRTPSKIYRIRWSGTYLNGKPYEYCHYYWTRIGAEKRLGEYGHAITQSGSVVLEEAQISEFIEVK